MQYSILAKKQVTSYRKEDKMSLLGTFAIMFHSKLLPFIYAIIGFGLLITVHEFGHFFFCKLFGIYTPSFSIGIGPKVIEKKIGTTNFKISALPIGGYVEIAGQSEIGQGEQKNAQLEGGNSFKDKPYWQKALVICGGVIFNLFLAYFLYSILFFVGIPKEKVELLIAPKIDLEITQKYDLRSNDKIIAINNENLSTEPKILIKQIHEKLVKSLTQNLDQTIKLTLFRDSQTIDINIKPRTKEFGEKILTTLFELSSTPIKGEYEKYPFFAAIAQGVKVTNQWIFKIFTAIKNLARQRTLKGAGGPIMIISQTFKTAQKGIIHLLIFLAFLSVNLAIINMLPIGALDGGQFLFITIEAIIRREIPEIIKLAINIASWVLILGLILYLSYKDLIYLITGKHI